MKKICITVLVALFACVTAQAQSCLPEGITFTTQGQVDSFSINYPGCRIIEGDVVISTSGSNLYGISNIDSIQGDLIIANNPHLINLQGLDNLISIGGSLQIGSSASANDSILFKNVALVNLQGINNLITIGNSLIIQGNPELSNLEGINNLNTVKSDVIIDNNTLVSGSN